VPLLQAEAVSELDADTFCEMLEDGDMEHLEV
jgi:hypothetical protein